MEEKNQHLTAFFGGSFDPPHCGHLGVARGVLAAGACSEVAWVPAWQPPHKSGRRRAPFDHRCRMVEMMIRSEEGMYLSRLEGELSLSPSYTILVLENWRRRYGTLPALLIGADSLLEFHLWHRAEELAEMCAVLTYPRPGYPVTPEALERFWPPETARKLFSGVLPGEFFEISSTDLRKKMAKSPDGCNIISGDGCYAVPDDVTAYAVKHGLYEEQKDK